QVLGYFNFMDGGFEGQTVAAVPALSSIAAGASSSTWSVTTAGVATIQTTVARTGTKSCNFYTTSTTKRLQSPTLPSPAQQSAANTAYTIQYYYRTAGAVATAATMQAGLSSAGTGDGVYTTATSFAATSGVWTKYSTPFTTKSAVTPSSPVGIIRENIAMVTAIDIDDYCIYPGSLDVTAPDAPTAPSIPSPAATQMTVSWTAAVVGAGNGVDGGGYMVVRGLADPATTPNANGIYAVGNTVAAGEQVVYLGTGTSFNDTGLTPSTPYYYRIYSVDKAFNYSTPIAVNATTTIPSYAAEPTAQVTGLSFSPVSSTGFTINWTPAVSGSGTNHLVVVKAASDITAEPADGSSYTADPAFATGSAIGGGKVVYNGTGNSVIVTGLSKAIMYYVRIYDFNGTGGSENYLVTGPTSGSQLASPGEISSTGLNVGTVSYSTGSAWVGGVVPTRYDNVTIVSPDVINVGSTQACYNLTIQSGAKIAAGSQQYIDVYGTNLTCNGTLGDPSNTVSLLYLEFGGNLNINGSGSIYPWKLRPITGLTNIGITFDANVSLTMTGTTMIFDNIGNDNVYFTINSPRTLSIANNFNTCSSSATQSTSNNTLTINSGATVNVAGVLNTNEVVGKTYTANINGTLAVTGTSTLSGTSGGGVATFNVNGAYSAGNLLVTPSTAAVAPVINVGSTGAITVNGTADFSSTTLLGYIANAPSTSGGTFSLGTGGTINIANASGLEPVAGPIRTTTRNFNTAANYSFVGSSAQVPGSDFPATVNNLTINNAAGLSLGASTTVSGTLTLTSGKVTLGANDLTIGTAISGGSATSYIVTDGVGKVTTPAAMAVATLIPIGASATSYDPVSVTPTTASTFAARAYTTLSGTAVYGVRYNPKEWDITPAVASSTLIALTPSNLVEAITSPVIGHYLSGDYVNNNTVTVTGSTYSGTFDTFSPFVTGANIDVTAITNAADNAVNAYGLAGQLIVGGTLAGDMISVYGLNGQTIKNVKATSNQTLLNLNKGMYLVKVKSQKDSNNFKVVLK
ncbi:MAG: T9SS type A sorting domain-containing protein, partial [Paludibacter sp.]